MADLAATAVVVNSKQRFGGPAGKELVMLNVTLTLTAQGSSTNRILPSSLGLRKIMGCSNFYTSSITTRILLATVNPAGSNEIRLTDSGQLGTIDGVDYTATVIGNVWGYS